MSDHFILIATATVTTWRCPELAEVFLNGRKWDNSESKVRIFSDKKLFTVDQGTNARNGRYSATCEAMVKHPPEVSWQYGLELDGSLLVLHGRGDGHGEPEHDSWMGAAKER